MKIIFEGKIIDRETTDLDMFVMDFVDFLHEAKINYVIVSGYVSILFGRSRLSEDIDVILEKLDKNRFNSLWSIVIKDFECLNTQNKEEAYTEYISKSHAIRFSRKGKYIPNIELKFPSTDLDNWSLENKKESMIDGKKLCISSLELQIAFKFFLGSEKDIEDAKYLYILFKELLDKELLDGFLQQLRQEENFKRYINESPRH